MAKRRTDSNRRGLAAWLMMLLPAFMFVGMLAPAAVKVKPQVEDETGPITFRNFSPRRPIQYAFPSAGTASPQLRVEEPAFTGARLLPGEPKRELPVDVAAASAGNEIVLAQDNVENYVAETLFEAPIDDPQPRLVVDLTQLWDPSLFGIIPDLIDHSAWTQWDDFHGTSTRFPRGAAPINTVPEPATVGLLAIGLASLALRRKRA